MDLNIVKLNKKIDKAKADGKWDLVSEILRKRANYYFSHGRYEEALNSFLKERDACEIINDSYGVANANRMVGEMYTELGNYEEALKYINLYLEYAKSKKDKVEEQRAMATLGRTYFCWASELSTQGVSKTDAQFLALLKKCRKYYMMSMYICENELGNVSNKERAEMKGRLWCNLGLVAEIQDDLNTSHEYINKALPLFLEENLYEDLHRSYLAQGMLYLKQENTQLAIKAMDRALEICKHFTNSTEKKVITLIHKSEVYLSMNNLVSARNTLKTAYKLKSPNETDHGLVESMLKTTIAMISVETQLQNLPAENLKERKELYEKLGDGCCDVKNYKHAIHYYLKMLECAEKLSESEKDLLPCYVSLVQTLKDDKQYKLALEYCEKELACSSFSPSESCKSLLTKSEILELNGASVHDVSSTLNKALELSKTALDIKLQATVLKNMLLVYNKYGKIDLAMETENELEKLRTEHGYRSEDSDSDNMDTPDIGKNLNLEDVLTDSEVEEEYDRPRKRPARSTFKIKRNEKGETQLHVAIIKGDLNRAKSLVEQGHPVKEQDLNGWTPLHEACNHGYLEIVDFLLKHGADINDPGGKGCKGITPLHDAASCGHLEIVEFLLDRGAIVTSLTDDGETALDCLKEWRKRVELNSEEIARYSHVCDTMQTKLEVAGFVKNTNTKKKPNRRKEVKNLRRGGVLETPKTSWFEASPEHLSGAFENEFSPLIDEERREACNEYHNAIAGVRKHTNRLSVTQEIEKESPALLPETEIVDDWLEDDINVHEQRSKRRKITSLLDQDGMRKSVKRRSEENVNSEYSSVIEEIEETQRPQIQKQSSFISVPVSVSGNGMDQEIQSIRPSIVEHSQPVSVLNKVKVKIEEHRLLISIPDDNNLKISWLMDEVSKRFHQLEGMEPIVRLKTSEDAILSSEDPLLLVCGEDLTADVMSWKATSVVDKYRESCTSDPDPYICSILEMCRATQCLNLEYLALSSPQLTPVFKAIKVETELRGLYLSGNNLTNDCVSILCESLDRLSNLSCINLSCSNLTDASLHQIYNTLMKKKEQFWSELSCLDLSFNPLTDDSLNDITNLSKQIKKIELFHTQGCDKDFNL